MLKIAKVLVAEEEVAKEKALARPLARVEEAWLR